MLAVTVVLEMVEVGAAVESELPAKTETRNCLRRREMMSMTMVTLERKVESEDSAAAVVVVADAEQAAAVEVTTLVCQEQWTEMSA